MPEKEKKDLVDYDEKIVSDEMQRTLSFELEHKYMRLWYVLISFTMPLTGLIFVAEERSISAAVQMLILTQYGIMYLCVSLYNYKAAEKGVLDSFSEWQKGGRGLMYFVGYLNWSIPIVGLVVIQSSSNKEFLQAYMPFFCIWLVMAMTYYALSTYSVWKNKKVRDSLAVGDEDTEEE